MIVDVKNHLSFPSHTDQLKTPWFRHQFPRHYLLGHSTHSTEPQQGLTLLVTTVREKGTRKFPPLCDENILHSSACRPSHCQMYSTVRHSSSDTFFPHYAPDLCVTYIAIVMYWGSRVSKSRSIYFEKAPAFRTTMFNTTSIVSRSILLSYYSRCTFSSDCCCSSNDVFCSVLSCPVLSSGLHWPLILNRSQT